MSTQVVATKSIDGGNVLMSFGPELNLPRGRWKSPTTGNVTKINDKGRSFIEAYVGVAKWNASKAAEFASYSHAHTQGPALARKFREVIDWWIVEHRALLVISPQECLEILAGVARNTKHKDQLRAVELAMKAHGMLSEKLLISTDRKTLELQLNELIAKFGRSQEIIDIKAEPGPMLIEEAAEEQGLAVVPTLGPA